MKNKQDPTRLHISLRPLFPEEKFAMEKLDSKGRSKGAYIARAIYFYEKALENPALLTLVMQITGGAQPTVFSSEKLPSEQEPLLGHKAAEIIPAQEGEKDENILTEDILSKAIAGINAFNGT